MLKAANNEGNVDIGKREEDILESRKDNLKSKKLNCMFFKIPSLETKRRGIG